jgi:probable phosphomutase (TIGR03848 family)
MARVIFVRHAPTPETGRVLTGRRPGVGLDETGIAIAGAARDALREVRFASVVTSPVQRCRGTAAIVAEPHRVDPRVDAGFEEVDMGTWEGRTLQSLRRLKAWQTVQAAPSRFRFPDGETFHEVQARAVAAVERAAAAAGRRTVVVCSHADVIKLVLAHYLGQPLDLFQRIGCSPASISVVDLTPGLPAHIVQVNGRSAP